MREIIEEGLREKRYFMLGSDTHNLASLAIRMNGLHRAIELVGEAEVAGAVSARDCGDDGGV